MKKFKSVEFFHIEMASRTYTALDQLNRIIDIIDVTFSNNGDFNRWTGIPYVVIFADAGFQIFRGDLISRTTKFWNFRGDLISWLGKYWENSHVKEKHILNMKNISITYLYKHFV